MDKYWELYQKLKEKVKRAGIKCKKTPVEIADDTLIMRANDQLIDHCLMCLYDCMSNPDPELRIMKNGYMDGQKLFRLSKRLTQASPKKRSEYSREKIIEKIYGTRKSKNMSSMNIDVREKQSINKLGELIWLKSEEFKISQDHIIALIIQNREIDNIPSPIGNPIRLKKL